MILNDRGKETEGINVHLSLQHYCHILLSLIHFKHRENVNKLLRKLLVSIESRQPLENIIISLLECIFNLFLEYSPFIKNRHFSASFPSVCVRVHTSVQTQMLMNIHMCIILVQLFLNFLHWGIVYMQFNYF